MRLQLGEKRDSDKAKWAVTVIRPGREVGTRPRRLCQPQQGTAAYSKWTGRLWVASKQKSDIIRCTEPVDVALAGNVLVKASGSLVGTRPAVHSCLGSHGPPYCFQQSDFRGPLASRHFWTLPVICRFSDSCRQTLMTWALCWLCRLLKHQPTYPTTAGKVLFLSYVPYSITLTHTVYGAVTSGA